MDRRHLKSDKKSVDGGSLTISRDIVQGLPDSLRYYICTLGIWVVKIHTISEKNKNVYNTYLN